MDRRVVFAFALLIALAVAAICARADDAPCITWHPEGEVLVLCYVGLAPEPPLWYLTHIVGTGAEPVVIATGQGAVWSIPRPPAGTYVASCKAGGAWCYTTLTLDDPAPVTPFSWGALKAVYHGI